MKRSQLNLSNKDLLKHLKSVKIIRWGQLHKEKTEGRISKYELNAEQEALLQMVELAEAWDKQGYTYKEIKETIEALPPRGRRQAKQQNLFPN